MKLKKRSLSAMGIAIATMMVVISVMGCETLDTINVEGDAYIATDAQNPTLYILNPYKNITNNNFSNTIMGIAVDNKEVMGVYLSRNSSPFRQTAGTTNWFTNITDLVSGSNFIQVYAEDKFGNTSYTQGVNIFVDTNAESSPNIPAVAISKPADGLITNIFVFPVNIGAAVGEPATITNIILEVYGNDDLLKYTISEQVNGTLIGTILQANNLTLGSNLLIAYALADNGQTAMFTNHCFIDTTPTVTLNPSNDITTNEIFTAMLGVDEDYGYWSTNGSPFMQFTTAGTSVDISGYVELQYYGADITGNTTSTQSVVYSMIPDVSIVSGPTGDIISNEVFTVDLTLNTTENYGYFSTNNAPFEQFLKGNKSISFVVSNYTSLRFYGSGDGVYTSSTQSVNYYAGAVYVSSGGDDANDGKTIANAVLSIQKGVELAQSYSYANIYVEAGIYIQGAGLSNTVAGNNYAGVNIANADNINLIGGWNSSFTARTGYSELDGSGAAVSKHIIWVQDSANFTIDGFVIRDANANGSTPHNGGGGIYFINTSQSQITNSIISNNTASQYGGGVYINQGSHNNISAIISDNTAYNGGGVCINGSYNTISGTVSNNITGGLNYAGGGVLIYSGSYNTISGTISGNTAAAGGGVSNNGSYTTISGTISGNTATADFAGGVWNTGSAYWTGSWGSGNTPDNWYGGAPL